MHAITRSPAENRRGASDRVAVVAELFGEDTDRPAWQTGVRLVLMPDRLEVDLSYGDHLATDVRGTGFQAGFAFTAPAFR